MFRLNMQEEGQVVINLQGLELFICAASCISVIHGSPEKSTCETLCQKYFYSAKNLQASCDISWSEITESTFCSWIARIDQPGWLLRMFAGLFW